MEIILGLDLGKKRCGIAKADSLGILVSPVATVDIQELEDKLINLKQTFEIHKIIVGLPYNLGNQDTYDFILKQVAKLKQSVLADIEVIFEDESYSSKEAEQRMKAQGVTPREHNKSLLDMHSACIILEQYLQTNQKA